MAIIMGIFKKTKLLSLLGVLASVSCMYSMSNIDECCEIDSWQTSPLERHGEGQWLHRKRKGKCISRHWIDRFDEHQREEAMWAVQERVRQEPDSTFADLVHEVWASEESDNVGEECDIPENKPRVIAKEEDSLVNQYNLFNQPPDVPQENKRLKVAAWLEEEKIRERALKEQERANYKYICLVCCPPKRWKTKTALNEHSTIHSDKKQFYCKICERGIRTKTNYYTHIRKQHPEEMHFMCNACKLRFFNPLELKRHRDIGRCWPIN